MAANATNDKAKYAKLLKTPKWNEAIFSEEGYLVTQTNLDPKDERSYYHKKPKDLLVLDWCTSPKEGVLLAGKRDLSDLVTINYLSKEEKGWVNDEDKVNQALAKYAKHPLLSIHTTKQECPQLYTLTKVLSTQKVVVDLGVGFLIDVTADTVSNFDHDKYGSSLNKLLDFLLKSGDYFDQFEQHDKEAYNYLVSLGVELNLLDTNTARKSKIDIPGVDVRNLPYWENLTYTGDSVVNKEGSSGSYQQKRSVTPADKLESWIALMENGEAVSRLRKAVENLGHTLTPTELLSCLYGLSSGVALEFGSSSKECPDGSGYLSVITTHPNWDPNNANIKALLADEFDCTPLDLCTLTVEQIGVLSKKLDDIGGQ